MFRGLRTPFSSGTRTRVTQNLNRVFVDMSSIKSAQAPDDKQYTMIVHDDYSRYTRVYILKQKNDTIRALSRFLDDTVTVGKVGSRSSVGCADFEEKCSEPCD